MSATRSAPRAPRLAWTLAGCAVGQQIAYPLTDGRLRDVLTVSIVLTLAGSCVAHACATHGRAVALAVLGVSAVPGFAAELVGVHTGFPFGRYAYTGHLGPRLAGVPLVVALAWTMLAWPAAVTAGRLVRSPAARVAVTAWTMAALDLFLDPQLVGGGYWRWAHPSPHLPGVPDVPLTNLAGWLLVSAVIGAAVQLVTRPGRPVAGDLLPVALLLWLSTGWVIASAVFDRRPAAAGWGALAVAPVIAALAGRVVVRRSAWPPDRPGPLARPAGRR